MKELKEIFNKVIRQNYANFKGRAGRREFWLFFFMQYLYMFAAVMIIYLLMVILMISSFAMSEINDSAGVVPLIMMIFVYALIFVLFLPILVPSLAVTARRLHDTGRSGWWMLLSFIPFGGLIVAYFLIQQGNKGQNEYGEDPRIKEYTEYLANINSNVNE